MPKLDARYTAVGRRTNEQCRQAISEILMFEVSDERLRICTVTGVDVSPDKRSAKVFYTTEKDLYEQTDKCFEQAAGYIRKLLSQRLGHWRVVPALRFYVDPSVDLGEKIAGALEKEHI